VADAGGEPGAADPSLGGGTHADAVSERWLGSYPQTIWRRHSDAVNSALLERWLPAQVHAVLKTDLFDEAVSAGLYTALASRCERVVGIDLSLAIVNAAAARHDGLVALHADVRTMPFDDGAFAAVVSNSTLDHFDSPAEIVRGLREIARVLQPGGTLVLTLDNPWNPVIALAKALPRRPLNRAWIRLGGASSRIGLLPYYVGATMSLPRLRRLLGDLGFDVSDFGTIVHAPRAFAVIVANLLERHGGVRSQARFLRVLSACEALSRWPTRLVTGHFVAVQAVKRAQ